LELPVRNESRRGEAVLIAARDLVEAATGQRPPWALQLQLAAARPNTLSLLQELGYCTTSTMSAATSRSSSKVNGRDFVVVPYTLRNNVFC